MSTETATQLDGHRTDATGPAGPIEEPSHIDLEQFHEQVEAALAAGHDADPKVLHAMSLRLSDRFRPHPPVLFGWPTGWYIPGDADYHDYWFLPAPDANRFRYQWAGSQLYPPPYASNASAATGRVYAYTALRPSDTHDTAWAGVAARFTPANTLSYADVSVDVDLSAQSRIWMLLAGHTSNLPTAHERCTAYVCVWDIDPVTQEWTLVRPFGSRAIVNRSDSGTSGSAIGQTTVLFSGNDLSTRVQVQAGHSYAVGFQAQVDIDTDVRDDAGRPYQLQAGDDWKLWADMTCAVHQINVATTVLIP